MITIMIVIGIVTSNTINSAACRRAEACRGSWDVVGDEFEENADEENDKGGVGSTART